ncbi:unnamed protein product [Phytophthora fragariaefolia]|uniref:Unnamed protein product n=1 Tax=Phytophthora fragariaefolia TaxID=1490495 RepID=A0A9W6UAD8_9STRA|nr:unnamed protein product [Phytophthora fragariaefolia]
MSASHCRSPPLSLVDVRANEQRAHLRVHVLDGDLETVEAETVEAESLRHLDFVAEVHGQVLVHDAIARREEGQHVKRSLSVRFAHSLRSCTRSSSSAVQNEASAFLYICHTSCSWIGTARTGSGSPPGTGPAASRRSTPCACTRTSRTYGGEEPPATCHRESTIRDDSVRKVESELGAQVGAFLEEELNENLLLQRPIDF